MDESKKDFAFGGAAVHLDHEASLQQVEGHIDYDKDTALRGFVFKRHGRTACISEVRSIWYPDIIKFFTCRNYANARGATENNSNSLRDAFTEVMSEMGIRNQ